MYRSLYASGPPILLLDDGGCSTGRELALPGSALSPFYSSQSQEAQNVHADAPKNPHSSPASHGAPLPPTVPSRCPLLRQTQVLVSPHCWTLPLSLYCGQTLPRHPPKQALH